MKRTLSSFFSFLLLAVAPVFAAEPLVFDFESGDLASAGWAIVEGANTKPIGDRNAEFHDETVPYVKQGKRYLTTLESTANASPTDEVRCVIESPVFEIVGDELKFLVGGGGANRQNVYVGLALLDENGDVETVLKAPGKDNQKLDPVAWNVSEYKGRLALIRVVDLETGGWAHIRCDAFEIPGALSEAGTKRRRDFFEKARLEAERKEAERKEAALDALRTLDAPVLYVRRQQYRRDHHNTATLFQKGKSTRTALSAAPPSSFGIRKPASRKRSSNSRTESFATQNCRSTRRKSFSRSENLRPTITTSAK